MALGPFKAEAGLRLKRVGNGGWVVMGEPAHDQGCNIRGLSIGMEPAILGAYTSTADMMADLASALGAGDLEFTWGARG